MKTFQHIVLVMLLILAQLFLIVVVTNLLEPISTEEYRENATFLSTGKTPFKSAADYFYAEAKKSDSNLKKELLQFQECLDSHDYTQASQIMENIFAQYAEYTSSLTEQYQQSKVKYQEDELLAGQLAFQNEKYQDALQHLQNADENLASTQYMLGYIFLHFKNALDYTLARTYLEKAYAQNNENAAFELGLIYETGLDVTVDLPKAYSYYQAAYQNGIKKAIPKLAELSCRPEISDTANALNYNLELAKEGDAAATFRLAELLVAKGNLKASDWPTIEALYRKAANLNYIPAQQKMADFYLNGKITSINIKEQEKYYLLMAQNKKVEYQIALAKLYSSKALYSPKQAFIWWKEAADNGNPEACYNLATCYEKGIGTQTNQSNALKYYQYAAAHERKEALAWLKNYKEQLRIAAEKKAAEDAKRQEEIRIKNERLAKQQWLDNCFKDFKCCGKSLTAKISLLPTTQKTIQEIMPELVDTVIINAHNSLAYIPDIGHFSLLAYTPQELLLQKKPPKIKLSDVDKITEQQLLEKRAEYLSELIGVTVTCNDIISTDSIKTTIKNALAVKHPVYKVGDFVDIQYRYHQQNIVIKGQVKHISPNLVTLSDTTIYPHELPKPLQRHFDSAVNDKLINDEATLKLRKYNSEDFNGKIRNAIKYNLLNKNFIPKINQTQKIDTNINNWETVPALRKRIESKLLQSYNNYINN